MHIAVCDDDSMELARIASLLDAYRRERNICLSYQTYLSAAELLFAIKSKQYDLLLLDILMPGFTGLQAAQEVRTFDSGTNIIFFTSSPEFALESYAVKARDYILKPVLKEKLFSALDAVLAQEPEVFEGLSIRAQRGMAHILFSRLAFVEVMNKQLHFHLSDGEVRAVRASLTDYEQRLLIRPEFIKVHRAYLVNLWQMRELTPGGFVTHNGDSIPVSRLLYSGVRKAYLEHLFVETGAE
ncbi:MAG: LytTR family DNA-binding domain-containing protein [Ruthenibacterium sp.]